jgi:hypothetical protein
MRSGDGVLSMRDIVRGDNSINICKGVIAMVNYEIFPSTAWDISSRESRGGWSRGATGGGLSFLIIVKVK